MDYRDGELVLAGCGAHRTDINYPNFVAELEGRFLPDSTGDAMWSMYFGDSIIFDDDPKGHLFGNPNGYSVHLNGSINIGMMGGSTISFTNAAIPGNQTNHLLVIAKGARFAFYINGQPLAYVEDPSWRWGNIWFRAQTDTESPTIVAFDNFKIWDISDISIP